jgi:hypothetical protein
MSCHREERYEKSKHGYQFEMKISREDLLDLLWFLTFSPDVKSASSIVSGKYDYKT